MPDHRRHRGPHPDDAAPVRPRRVARLENGGCRVIWLLLRGYAQESSLKLVGDRHGLEGEATRGRRPKHLQR